MGALSALFHHMDWTRLLILVMSGVACLISLTVHELSHGLAARRLGDPTAQRMGRLTLHPLAHIDWVGLFLLFTVGVGWAKPVPVDMRYFKNPRTGMAITALAGPASNFILALLSLGVGSILFSARFGGQAAAYLLLFCCQLAVLNVGLGLFNLIPVPPLDGSKVADVFLPPRAYQWVLRYERYFMIAVIALAWLGVLAGQLNRAVAGIVQGMCALTRFPFELVAYYFF